MPKVQIVILCGGEGTRLKHITKNVPKCMYSVGGGPFLFYTFRHYAKFSDLIDSFVLCCSDKSEDIRLEMIRFFKKDGAFNGTELEDEEPEDIEMDDIFYENIPLYWATEPKPFGTLAALVSAVPKLKTDYVLVVNGDTYCEVNLEELLKTDYTKYITTALTHNGTHSGVWLVRSYILKTLAKNLDILNRNHPREIMLGFPGDGYYPDVKVVEGPPFIDMGTPEGLKQAKQELRRFK